MPSLTRFLEMVWKLLQTGKSSRLGYKWARHHPEGGFVPYSCSRPKFHEESEYRALVLVTLCYFGTCCTLVEPLTLPFSTSQLKFPFMDFEFPLQLAVTLGLVLIVIVILLLPSSLEVLLTLVLVSALVSVWLLTHLLYSPLCTGILHTDSTWFLTIGLLVGYQPPALFTGTSKGICYCNKNEGPSFDPWRGYYWVSH